MAASVLSAVAGHEGRVQIGNGQVGIINLNKWNINFTADDLPTRTFESLGYDSGISGFLGAEITIEGVVDLNKMPHTSPPGFIVGAIIGPVFLYVKKTGNRRYRFPLCRILAVPVQNESEGIASYSVKMKSNGPWTYAV